MYSSIDAILVIIYIGMLATIGLWRFRGRQSDVSEYLVMGRRLALPGFVASLVSTWYGGILGVSEYSYSYGLANWIIFGLPYYLGALIFALFLARRARRTTVYTIPDQLEEVYDRKTSLAGALLLFITTVPAAYILQVGLLAETVFGTPVEYGIIGAMLFSAFYLYTGGMRADVLTDRIQFVLMFTGFIIMLTFLFINYGGLEFIKDHVPKENLTWHGGRPIAYILVWYFIALGTLVEPSFYQRCFAAKSESIAQKGIFISIAFWALFDFMTTSTGLYARALLPNLSSPATAFPLLGAKVLPGILRGFFLLGLFATVMSTVDSYTFIAGQTFGKDFIHKIWGGDVTFLTRIGLAVAGATAIFIAIFKRSIVEIWYDFGSISTAALMIPLASSFSNRWKMRPNYAFMVILLGGLTVILWMILGRMNQTDRFLNLDSIYPGLTCALAIFILDHSTKNRI